MTPRAYHLHGLHVSSEVTLHERLAPPGSCDVSIVWDGPGEESPARGEVLARLTAGGRVLYEVERMASGAHCLHVYGVCDFEISPDLSLLRCRLHPGADPELVPILLRGMVVAVLLDLRGAPCLHASAVEVAGRVVAFAGPSGAGKTTMAALLCAAGARLVADDVLSVERGDEGPWCPAGSAELRLRNTAVGLLDRDDWVLERRLLLDGRLAVRPRGVDGGAPLGAIVFPTRSRSAHAVAVQRVARPEAVFLLASVPRIAGWQSPEALGRAFDHVARLAEEVPVFAATVPWGPPWNWQLPGEIAEAVGAARA